MKLMTAAAMALMLLAAPALYNKAWAVDGEVGKVTYAKGDVSLFQTGRSVATPMGKGDPVFAGDEIETGKNGSITVIFADKSSLSVGANGKIVVDQYKMDGGSAKTVRLNTGNGAFEWTGAQNGAKDSEITTDSGTVAVGNAHVVRGAKGAETTVYVQNGSAIVKTSGGKVDVAAGQGTTIPAKGAKPADPAPMGAEQVGWIRESLPTPATPWEPQGSAPVAAEPVATAPEQTAPVENTPAAPMEVPPMAAPAPEAAPAPVTEAVPAPVAEPVAAPVEAPVAAPVDVMPPAAPVEAPVPTAPPADAAAAPVQDSLLAPTPALIEPAPLAEQPPEANPQASVVTPTPAPAQIPMPVPLPAAQ